jgi:protein CWC15
VEDGQESEETPEVKRRRILEETREIDADSDGAASDSSDDDRYGRSDGLGWLSDTDPG